MTALPLGMKQEVPEDSELAGFGLMPVSWTFAT